MFEYRNTEYRNLQEQVLKNKIDIEDLSSVNGLLGIKVIGQIESIDDLPSTDSEEFIALEYGDAYILITGESTYTFYVKTRGNDEIEYDHWFNLNLAGIQGDIGPVGPKGDKGEKGEIGIIAIPTNDINTCIASDFEENQSVMTTNGNVYRSNGSVWSYLTNIRGVQGVPGNRGEKGDTGEQGPQGIQGPKGDVGGFIKIAGIIKNLSQIRSPSSIGDLTKAYLVGLSKPYNLYVQVGESSDTAKWADMGPLNVATYVSVNGEYVGLWDSDTKVDKKTTVGTYAYVHDGPNQTEARVIWENTAPFSIARRGDTGNVKVATAVADSDAVNLAQMNAALPRIIRI